MDTQKIGNVKLSEITYSVISLITKHAGENEDLKNDLLHLIKIIDNEQIKMNALKTLAFELANKLA